MTLLGRFNLGERICGQYKVQSIRNEDSTSQVVHVKKRGDGSKNVIRIITRARVKEVDITDEIAWLNTTCSFRHEFTKYLDYHTDIRYFYLVFEKHPRTLKEAIMDTKIHLSRRHIVEIAVQIIRATQHLNNHSVFDFDLCPENIELVEENSTEWYYSHEHGGFRSRTVLKTSQIRLAYYGKAGNDPKKGAIISERYKSPEHVYDMVINASSNVFSIGCILAELLLRYPLFPICLAGPLYTREKTVVYDTILGPFPDAMIHDIRRSFKGVFKHDDSDFPEYAGLSRAVQDFCEQAEPLKVNPNVLGPANYTLNQSQFLIIEELANDVVECMTYLDPSRRVPLSDIMLHPFFDPNHVS